MNEKRLAKARRRLLDEVQAEARDTESWTGRAAFSGPVMEALARVPRHAFLRDGQFAGAYVNRPQSIGHGQTISQPYIVALMTELLDLARDDRVLEIGTGSGYQTAVLAELAVRVFSVEVVEALATNARRRLRELGYDTVAEREKWEREGWPDRSPGSERTPEGRRGCGFQLALLDSDAFEIVPGSAKQPAHLPTVPGQLDSSLTAGSCVT